MSPSVWGSKDIHMGVDGHPYGGRRTPIAWGLTQPHLSPQGGGSHYEKLPSSHPMASRALRRVSGLASLRARDVELRPLPPHPYPSPVASQLGQLGHVPEFRASGSSPPRGRSGAASSATGCLHTISPEKSRPGATSCAPARSQQVSPGLFRVGHSPSANGRALPVTGSPTGYCPRHGLPSLPCAAARQDLSVLRSDMRAKPLPGHEFPGLVGRREPEPIAHRLTRGRGA